MKVCFFKEPAAPICRLFSCRSTTDEMLVDNGLVLDPLLQEGNHMDTGEAHDALQHLVAGDHGADENAAMRELSDVKQQWNITPAVARADGSIVLNDNGTRESKEPTVATSSVLRGSLSTAVDARTISRGSEYTKKRKKQHMKKSTYYARKVEVAYGILRRMDESIELITRCACVW